MSASLRTICFCAALLACTLRADAEQVFQLRNGMVLRGSMAQIPTLKEGFGAAAAGQANVRPIWLIDDGLRRNYLHGKGMIAAPPVDSPNLWTPIELWQTSPYIGADVNGLGTILATSPFNEFGRRQLRMQGPPSKGNINVIQGITEINPRYAKLIALPAKGQTTLLWDMRVATSSLSTTELLKIFRQRTDWEDLDSRLEVLRFFISTERYADSVAILQQIINDFPAEKGLEKQLVSLTEFQGMQLLEEAKTRIASGQYQLAKSILDNFPLQELGRMARLQVTDVRQSITDDEAQALQLATQLGDQLQQLPEAQQQSLGAIVAEIQAGLSADTLPRLSDYRRLGAAETLELESRVALAISGWLMGAGAGEQNISIIISLVKVRELVREYLGTPDENRRKEILEQLRDLEGARPEYVDRMLPLLEPAKRFPADSAHDSISGYFQIQTESAEYLVQLPPEYNPLRSYPCVVALHEAGNDPMHQIEWWAGAYDPQSQMRLGHATRHGFIVVAPVWGRSTQRAYEYTPAEHERVLVALRDAMRRCSIDSDRVFLTGHGEGATAAWDMALAHPDLWAGMISISGAPSKTVHHFERNSRYVPLYLVMGQLDANVNDRVSAILDSYMTYQHDALVVAYRGRGREYFYDEIPRLFEWMKTKAHVRRKIPAEFETKTMRRGDQFFWWLELLDLKPDADINPILWDRATRIKSAPVTGTIGKDNQIRMQGPSDRFQVLLRPMEGLDLNEDIIVRYGSRSKRVRFDGGLETLLEDVRLRADRKRGFWLEIVVP